MTADNASFIVIASDGIWDLMESHELGTLLESNYDKIPPSDLIINHALEKICKKSNMKRRSLTALRKGIARRMKHDDITVIVIDMGDRNMLQSHSF